MRKNHGLHPKLAASKNKKNVFEILTSFQPDSNSMNLTEKYRDQPDPKYGRQKKFRQGNPDCFLTNGCYRMKLTK